MTNAEYLKRVYAVQYMVRPWNKPPSQLAEQVAPGIRLSPDDFGYADELLVVSMVRQRDTGEMSVAFFDSESGCGEPSREMMELVKEQIEHYLEHHCP